MVVFLAWAGWAQRTMAYPRNRFSDGKAFSGHRALRIVASAWAIVPLGSADAGDAPPRNERLNSVSIRE